jgi:hypothetical protein
MVESETWRDRRPLWFLVRDLRLADGAPKLFDRDPAAFEPVVRTFRKLLLADEKTAPYVTDVAPTADEFFIAFCAAWRQVKNDWTGEALKAARSHPPTLKPPLTAYSPRKPWIVRDLLGIIVYLKRWTDEIVGEGRTITLVQKALAAAIDCDQKTVSNLLKLFAHHGIITPVRGQDGKSKYNFVKGESIEYDVNLMSPLVDLPCPAPTPSLQLPKRFRPTITSLVEGAKDRPARTPGADEVSQFMELWPQWAPRLRPAPKTIPSSAIRKALRTRPLPEWKDVIVRANESNFLAGSGRSGWIADLTWVLENAEQVLSGRYDNRRAVAAADPDLRPAPKIGEER